MQESVVDEETYQAKTPRVGGAWATLTLIVDHQADTGLSADLDELAGDTTDDLDPL